MICSGSWHPRVKMQVRFAIISLIYKAAAGLRLVQSQIPPVRRCLRRKRPR